VGGRAKSPGMHAPLYFSYQLVKFAAWWPPAKRRLFPVGENLYFFPYFCSTKLEETTAKLQLLVEKRWKEWMGVRPNSMHKSWQAFCQLWLLPAGSKGRWSASNFNLKAKVFNFKSCLLPFSCLYTRCLSLFSSFIWVVIETESVRD